MTRLPKRARQQEDGGGRARSLPVELRAALFGLRFRGRDSPAANAFDDPECDVAIGLTADLEVLATASRGDLAERVAIEDRVHCRRRRRAIGARRIRYRFA